jgi:type IV pilus assembly protein PilM
VDRARLDAQVEMLAQLQLQPVAIDAGPCAIFRGFERFLRRDEDRNKVNAFVELGYSGTRVVIARGPDLIFFKNIPIGGHRFEEMISEQLELSPEEAGDIRVRIHRQHVASLIGQPPPSEPDEVVSDDLQRTVFDTLRPGLEHLSKEIALCLRYCSVTFRGLRSETVTVVGGEACNRDILRLLSDQVNVPFRIGRPMHNIGGEMDGLGAERRAGLPEWACACGLALKPVGDQVEAAA